MRTNPGIQWQGAEQGLRSGPGELFQLLRDGVPRTKSELVDLTGLARTTVVSRLEALVAARLIGPAGEGTSSGGRPPTRFVFNPAFRLVLGADIGASHAAIAVTDLAGTVLARHSEDRDIAAGPEDTLRWLVENGRRLIAELERKENELAGVGIGLPGPVEHESGRPVNPPIMPGWDGYDVPGFVRRELNVPVLVDNDVNIMALGERHVHWSGEDNLLFIKLATGIGAGIISSGRLQRGADGTSGDIGHIRVPDGDDIPCRCGNTGCLEAVASGPALAAKLRHHGVSAANGGEVIDLAWQGNVEAIHALRQAGRDVGEVLAICVNIINPSIIVVGGSLARAGDQLLAGAREAVYRRSLPLATRQLRIEQSRAREDAGIIGASCLVIEHILSPAFIERTAAQIP